MLDLARFEALLDVLDELRAANEATPVLVEGRRDVECLRDLGLPGEIAQLHDGRALFERCEDLARDHGVVIVLTDWDRKGGFLHAEATRAIEASGGRVDASFRERVRLYLDLPLNDVESLAGYVRKGLETFFRESLEDHLAKARGHAHRAA